MADVTHHHQMAANKGMYHATHFWQQTTKNGPWLKPCFHVHVYVCVLSVSTCPSASTSISRFASVDRYTVGWTVWYPCSYTHTRHSLLHCTVSQSNLEITIIYQPCPGSLHATSSGCWPRCLPISRHLCGLDLWNCRCRDFPSGAQPWVLHGRLSGFFLAPWSMAKHVDPTVVNKWCF